MPSRSMCRKPRSSFCSWARRLIWSCARCSGNNCRLGQGSCPTISRWATGTRNARSASTHRAGRIRSISGRLRRTSRTGDDVLILSLDTTTKAASCAVARDGVVLNEERIDPTRQVALQLPVALRDILDLSAIALDEIDAFAVATGPGSFTGLRIGIATMQGLAFGQRKPLIGISGLTALRAVASPAFLGSRIATWVDAWRGDVYGALFEDGGQVGEPVVARPADLLDGMLSGSRIPDRGSRAGLMANDITFIGDGAETY